MSASRVIHVFWDGTPGQPPAPLGLLTVGTIRGKEVCSFAFDTAWLKNNPARTLDPDLQLYAGPQFPPNGTFGIFGDSAPDRWGRMLMQRREAAHAREEGRAARKLAESDYLLGVHDATRMGALRFKLRPDGPFLNDDDELSAPPWARLRELEEACRHVEDDDGNGTERTRWLRMLVAPGSSLGGARPKANVTDPKGRLWIAKFPSRHDTDDAAAWEYALMLMAHDAGLRTPEVRLEKLSRRGTTFLTRRFDRTDAGGRVPFCSAMTALGRTDGDGADGGTGYLDIAEWITRSGAAPEKDLPELWARIVFSIAVSNTDDHLRNHGFLMTKSGWTLSPVYDLNPNPGGTGLALNISETDNTLDFTLAEEVAPAFRLNAARAGATIKKIRAITAHWRRYATRAGISAAGQNRMAPAFR